MAVGIGRFKTKSVLSVVAAARLSLSRVFCRASIAGGWVVDAISLPVCPLGP